jgi:hypothetical protein
MTSYLRSWLLGVPSEVQEPKPSQTIHEVPELEIIEPQEEDDQNSDDGYDTDRPPAFPAVNSIQRASASTRVANSSSNGGLMAPPPPRSSRSPQAPSNQDNLTPLATTKVFKKSKKVMLAPGHSTLDWANLKGSGEDLRVSLQVF